MRKVALAAMVLLSVLAAGGLARADATNWTLSVKAGYFDGTTFTNSRVTNVGATSNVSFTNPAGFIAGVANIASLPPDCEYINYPSTYNIQRRTVTGPLTSGSMSFRLVLAVSNYDDTATPEYPAYPGDKVWFTFWGPASTSPAALDSHFTVDFYSVDRETGVRTALLGHYTASDLRYPALGDPVTVVTGPYTFGGRASFWNEYTDLFDVEVTASGVPEPSSIVALLCGVCGAGGLAWRKRK